MKSGNLPVIWRKLFPEKNLFFFGGLLILFSCTSDEFVTPGNVREVRIDLSINTLSRDIYPSDLMYLGQEGFLVFGLCSGNQMSSRFDSNGSIYVMKLDQHGFFEWDTCYTRNDRGFPSNVIRGPDNHFYLFWNSFDRNRDLEVIKISLNNTLEINSYFLNNLSQAGEVIHAIQNFSNDGYYLIGLYAENSENNFINIVEVNEDFSFRRILTSRYFQPRDFGGFGLNDIQFLRRVSNFIKIFKNHGERPKLNRLVFTGPQNSVMTISHVGEIIPEYSDDIYWVSNLKKIDQTSQQYAALISDVDNVNSKSYFSSELDLKGPPSDRDPLNLIDAGYYLDQIDPQSKTPLLALKRYPGTFLIGGTTDAGQIRLFRVNGEDKKSITVGTQNKLEISDMAEMNNGMVLITGQATINNEIQKPFIMILDPADF